VRDKKSAKSAATWGKKIPEDLWEFRQEETGKKTARQKESAKDNIPTTGKRISSKGKRNHETPCAQKVAWTPF